MTNSEKSKKLSLDVQKRLNQLFIRTYDVKRSTGALNAFYDTSRTNLQADFTNTRLIDQVFNRLRVDIRNYSNMVFGQAQALGERQAIETAEIFDIPAEGETPQSFIDRNISAVDDLVKRQYNLILGLVLSGGATKELLLGREGQYWGILDPRIVGISIKNLIASVLNSFYRNRLGQLPEDEYGYQAIAIVDDITSQTCKNVNGQVQPIGKPFQLTAQPRYADFMLKPPFHDGCRTTLALVKLDEVEEVILTP